MIDLLSSQFREMLPSRSQLVQVLCPFSGIFILVSSSVVLMLPMALVPLPELACLSASPMSCSVSVSGSRIFPPFLDGYCVLQHFAILLLISLHHPNGQVICSTQIFPVNALVSLWSNRIWPRCFLTISTQLSHYYLSSVCLKLIKSFSIHTRVFFLMFLHRESQGSFLMLGSVLGRAAHQLPRPNRFSLNVPPPPPPPPPVHSLHISPISVSGQLHLQFCCSHQSLSNSSRVCTPLPDESSENTTFLCANALLL